MEIDICNLGIWEAEAGNRGIPGYVASLGYPGHTRPHLKKYMLRGKY